jgi:hypothetical protein
METIKQPKFISTLDLETIIQVYQPEPLTEWQLETLENEERLKRIQMEENNYFERRSF